MEKTFLKYDKEKLTVMIQARKPDRIKELIDKSLPEGAEALGIQFEKLNEEYQTPENYKDLIDYAKDKPVYATFYRNRQGAETRTDEQLGEEILKVAECGATLCDVMGDLYDKQPDEVAVSEDAIKKQMQLIDELHKKGAEVLMSSHTFVFTSAERVLEIAEEHQRRGADISKIVTGADTEEQQLENIKIVNLLKKNLKIPFLFISVGESRILRKIGGELGNCMTLCVYEHDDMSTQEQPLLKNAIAIRNNM